MIPVKISIVFVLCVGILILDLFRHPPQSVIVLFLGNLALLCFGVLIYPFQGSLSFVYIPTAAFVLDSVVLWLSPKFVAVTLTPNLKKFKATQILLFTLAVLLPLACLESAAQLFTRTVFLKYYVPMITEGGGT